MEKHQVKLECLRIVHRHGLSAEQVVMAARSYEAYVLEGDSDTQKNVIDLKESTNPKQTVSPVLEDIKQEKKEEKTNPSQKSKKAGNPNIFE